MCNLHSITINHAAIAALSRVVNRYVGNLPPMPEVFPDYPAPVVHNACGERELTMKRWDMPPLPKFGGAPVTNIRNTSSPHWRGWLKLESRCLVPANSFSEYATEPNPATGKEDVVWFALDDDRPLFALAGIWTEYTGDRGTKSKPIPGPHNVYGFLTASPNADPPQGHADHPDDRQGTGRVDARAMERGQGAATTVGGWRAQGRRPRRGRGR
jgi:putative SOS response-associated peptidase YedK